MATALEIFQARHGNQKRLPLTLCKGSGSCTYLWQAPNSNQTGDDFKLACSKSICFSSDQSITNPQFTFPLLGRDSPFLHEAFAFSAHFRR